MSVNIDLNYVGIVCTFICWLYVYSKKRGTVPLAEYEGFMQLRW